MCNSARLRLWHAIQCAVVATPRRHVFTQQCSGPFACVALRELAQLIVGQAGRLGRVLTVVLAAYRVAPVVGFNARARSIGPRLLCRVQLLQSTLSKQEARLSLRLADTSESPRRQMICPYSPACSRACTRVRTPRTHGVLACVEWGLVGTRCGRQIREADHVERDSATGLLQNEYMARSPSVACDLCTCSTERLLCAAAPFKHAAAIAQ